jgi:hypothetical protein
MAWMNEPVNDSTIVRVVECPGNRRDHARNLGQAPLGCPDAIPQIITVHKLSDHIHLAGSFPNGMSGRDMGMGQHCSAPRHIVEMSSEPAVSKYFQSNTSAVHRGMRVPCLIDRGVTPLSELAKDLETRFAQGIRLG